MKKTISLLLLFLALQYTYNANAQDVRTTETKVADLLARVPAGSQEAYNAIMAEMLRLGDTGLDMICSQVSGPGQGDDSRARYAVSGLSYYLTDGTSEQRSLWEKICIRHATESDDVEVKRYFFAQLALTGGDDAVMAVSPALSDTLLYSSAISTLESIGSEKAAEAIMESLDSETSLAPAQSINALGRMGYTTDTDVFIRWYEKGDATVKNAALAALALNGSDEAFSVIDEAVKKASYQWDNTNAMSSLLLYAKTIGSKGNIKKTESIVKAILKNCNDPETNNYRVAALAIITDIKGVDALPLLLKSIDDPDNSVRGGVARLALTIPGEDATRKWIAKYNKVSPDAKADIIYMLGERGDMQSVPLVLKAMEEQSPAVYCEAIAALAKLEKKNAVDPILSWMQNCDTDQGLNAAATALTTLLDSTTIGKVAASLKTSKEYAAVMLINIISWSGDKHYFKAILPYASSGDLAVRATALRALKNLASADDQELLISLVVSSNDRPETEALQEALVAAAILNQDEEGRSDVILNSLAKGSPKEKLIPVLAYTGGRRALDYVLKEFENGDAGMRDICFSTLAGWSDYSASDALYEICVSGNKTFSKAAFDSYIRLVVSAPVTDDNRLLLIKKIAPFAFYPDSRAEMVVKAGAIRTYPAFFFVASYLGDEDSNVAAWAARALMNIALPHDEGKPGLYGVIVREGLNRAINLITGPESEYDKERIQKYLASMPADEGFVQIFNGKDLTGWHGLVGNPITRAGMSAREKSALQKKADAEMASCWSVADGNIVFNGKGNNLCTIKEYGDFEMLVDWKITRDGDSGIYLRGTPQVQIWDIARVDVGAQVGSGGLYNNKINASKPLSLADNKVGEWNNFHIICSGNRVSVWLNGILVTDNVVFENYWDPSLPIFEKGPVELQAHGTDLQFRDIYVREIKSSEFNLTGEEKNEGFVSLFNGRNLEGWTGDTISYKVQNGDIVITPGDHHGGNLYTVDEYSDFIFRFEFQLTPGANNGLGIRAPLEGDAAYVGMELQILDNTDPIYADLMPYQYHGSVYGVIPARREFLKPVGEWNYEEVVVKGTHIKVILNGTVIVDGDISDARDNGTMDHKEHPGLKNSTGHIGFLGHGSVLHFRNIRVKRL